MRIVNNGYSVEVQTIKGQKCISLVSLAYLDGHHYTEICKKVRDNPSLKQYIVMRRDNMTRDRHITLAGCIKLCNMFRFPNDELIKKLLEIVSDDKPTAEEIVDAEIKRLDNEKLDFENLNQRVSNLEVKTNDIVAGLSISTSQFKERIEDLENKLEDVEINPKDIDNHLSYLNDKPNKSSFKDLLKECIKEIIKEELTNERA